MLVFILKKEWFEKIKSGEKTHEYREYKPYWIKRFENYFYLTDIDITLLLISENTHLQISNKCNKSICFQLGYGGEKLIAKALTIRIIDGRDTDLKTDKPVFDIEFELIKEQQ